MPKGNRRRKRPQTLQFSHRLVLNQWLIEQCGFDPLAMHRAGEKTLSPLQGMADILRNCPGGVNADNLHNFFRVLESGWRADAPVSRADLLRYEQNIASHTLTINERRPRPIVWKYFQWLSLLFVEIYLERYFNQRDKLRSDLNEYVGRFNAYWEERGLNTGVEPYTYENLNKVCLQNATGSGKTLLMHVNFLQFRQYADASRFRDDLTGTLLITPNEALSRQHAREMAASGIRAKRLFTDCGDLFTAHRNGMRQIEYTEVTKLSDEDGPNQMAVRNLGVQNLLLVDEAHRGMGGKEETGWFRRRERLVEKGFVFEYSATFKEAMTAANRPEIDTAYSKNILFDYSYRYFYEDGYGKDYRIFNLPQSYEQSRLSYLTACLLSFYQQLKLYEDRKMELRDYNLEKPLWVFVGKSVTRAAGTREERHAISDVALILQFLARVLKDRSSSAATIERILCQNAQVTGLLDGEGQDIFAGSFHYVRELLRRENWTYGDLLQDIFRNVFLSSGGGRLTLARIKGDDSEVMLRVGQAEIPFGLINVGDAAGLVRHIGKEKESRPEEFSNLAVMDAEFSETLFGQVHESSSPVTVLLGSKKFVEGWDCWRVSTLGLMHVGRSEGSQIIQLFGRGVRLKGYGWTLQRSRFANLVRQPRYIQYLETLNVFGVGSDFMDRFKAFLIEEELPSMVHHTILLNVTHDFGKELKVLRPRRKDRDGNEYDFMRDAKVPCFGDLPGQLGRKTIAIDWYPRIQSLESRKETGVQSKNVAVFSPEHLSFLDYDSLYFGLEKFKRERTWHNLNIPKPAIRKILQNTTWYKMYVPTRNMEKDDIANIFLWQEMASELLRKYCEELYNHCKAAFMEPRLELRTLTKEDENIPGEKEYELIVDSSEQALIDDILALKSDISQARPGILRAGELKACLFDTHLYQPVMHVAGNSKIKIAPVSLNESEFQFVEDLMIYLEEPRAGEFYLLRNKSRGKGIGFFEAGNFYPDFLLWKIGNDMQYIAFIEPHGLMHEGPGHRKIEFHKTIKRIQSRLANEKVCLNSFIVTPTRFTKLNWTLDVEELARRNVFFMRDHRETYISRIISRMEE